MFEQGIESGEREELPSKAETLGWTIEHASDPSRNRVTTDIAGKRIVINPHAYSSLEAARFSGYVEVAKAYGLSQLISEVSVEDLMSFFDKKSGVVSDLCLFEGLGFLSRGEPATVRELTAHYPAADTYEAEFRSACAWYILTGSFPSVSQEVRERLDSLPVSQKTGKHLLTSFSGGDTSFDVREKNYDRFIVPTLESLRGLDSALKVLSSDAFVPSTDTSQMEALSEKDILMRIEPFVGGYMPERVYTQVDWNTMEMVDPGASSVRWREPEDIILPKISRFTGTFTASQLDEPHRIPLSLSAIPLSKSITSSYALRRDATGCFLLERVGEKTESAMEIVVSFDFGLSREGHEWMTRPPSDEESFISNEIVQTLSPETLRFLEELRTSNITDGARATRIAQRIRETLEYVQDSAVGNTYKQAGTDYLKVLEQLKKADCDVSNFYGLALLRTLGIPCVMLTGYDVKRDKRFPFAALAGAKHAWLMYYAKEEGEWRRIDMTPPSQNDQEEDEDDESGSGGDNLGFTEKASSALQPDEGDIGEESGSAFVWSPEDIILLREALAQGEATQDHSDLFPGVENPEEVFMREYGVSLDRWNEVRTYIEGVDRTVIPRDETGEKSTDSTIGEEWDKIFELLLIAYQLPQTGRPQIVRQSQGSYLIDPVSAGIDVLSGKDDPFGYLNRTRSMRTEYLPINFSNDILFDLTASMDSRDENGVSLKEAQRQFVLSDLFHSYKLNEELAQHESELEVVPSITNVLFSIHGGAFRQQADAQELMTPKRISELYSELNTVTAGAGNILGALKAYRDQIRAESGLLERIQNGEIFKTLTIISDGNLWCSVCGQESCNYQLHSGIMRQTGELVNELRALGIFVNAIGFTELSRPVVELFKDEKNPQAAQVASDARQAVVLHHGQIAASLDRVRQIANQRLEFLKSDQ